MIEALSSFAAMVFKGLAAAGPFFLLLGVLIFIHELGHFLAARFFGVKVEVFSLGFGPKILKYKKGETTYCLSLLPLGGYVKMFGDSPFTEVSDSEKTRGFLYKKPAEKWIIAFAGPFMNLLFALFACFLLALYGRPVLPPQLGDISPDSKAWAAGFRSGDKILSVKGQKISYYKDLNRIIKNSIGEKLSFKVQARRGGLKKLMARPALVKNTNPLSWGKNSGAIEGLRPASKSLKLGVIHNSPAYKAGLRTFDKIVQINGQRLRYWRDLEDFIKKENFSELLIKASRGSEIKSFKLKAPPKTGALRHLGLEPSSFYIARIGPDTPAARAGILKGDRILSLNGKIVKSWRQVLEAVSSSKGGALTIVFRRGEKQISKELHPQPLFVEGNIKKRFMLGIASGGEEIYPEPLIQKYSFLQAAVHSGKETAQMLGFVSAGLVRLFQGKISLRTVGGPIMIGRAAHSQFRAGFSSFLYLMALISLNLFLLNLLPIPLLDGGHILFFTLEGIIGRPLDLKKLLAAQQAGLILLVSFMGFAFFNDIYNWLKAW